MKENEANKEACEYCGDSKSWNKWRWHHGGGNMGGGALYGLGVIGAAVYYLKLSTTFGMGVLGIIKAIAWPAMIVYKVFTMLNM